MYINEIHLRDFRNYDELDIEVYRQRYYLVGDNAQGKTNLLEAIYMCSMGKSFRTNDSNDVIRFGQDTAVIDSLIRKGNLWESIGLTVSHNSPTKATVYGMEQKSLSRILGLYNCVCFSPSDVMLIHDAPSERRRYLDKMICQISTSYAMALRDYDRILRQRNALLKGMERYKPDDFYAQLDVFDEQLSKAGCHIFYQRNLVCDMFGYFVTERNGALSDEKSPLFFKYETCVSEECEGLEAYMKMLKSSRRSDMRLRYTTFGVHKDDFSFELGGKDMRDHASQGQMRTAMIAMKLAQVDYLRYRTNYFPTLLLDDVFSELDSTRRKYLLKSLRHVQTFITGTEENLGYDKYTLEPLYVKDGFVSRKKNY